jgi:predicted Fe-Mo cluster-binding NifX family protein
VSDTIKIAVASEDGRSVSPHFGRSPLYAVFTIEHNRVVTTEHRPKPGHRDFTGKTAGPVAKHEAMAAPVADCRAVIAGGMGDGAAGALRSRGLEVVLTDEGEAETAALRYAAGDLPNLANRIHRGHGAHR